MAALSSPTLHFIKTKPFKSPRNLFPYSDLRTLNLSTSLSLITDNKVDPHTPFLLNGKDQGLEEGVQADVKQH